MLCVMFLFIRSFEFWVEFPRYGNMSSVRRQSCRLARLLACNSTAVNDSVDV